MEQANGYAAPYWQDCKRKFVDTMAGLFEVKE